MSLAAKITAGFAVLVVLMLASSGSQLALISRLHDESRDLSQISFETASSSLRLEAQVARLRELTLKLRVLGDPDYAARVARVGEEISADLARLEALDLGDAERRELGRLRQLWAARADPVAARTSSEAELESGFEALRSQLEVLRSTAREAMVARVAASGERIERARRNAWVTALVGLLAAALISVGIGRSLALPLRRLAGGTRAVAEGDFSHRVPASGGPELAALAEDFNAMALQLSELDQLKKDFVANVSHDLKTPLASIQEATRLLLEGIPGPLAGGQRRLLELNLKSGERLFRMLEDLLHLSQLESGSVDYSLRRQDVVELGRSALEELGALLGEAPGSERSVESDFPRRAGDGGVRRSRHPQGAPQPALQRAEVLPGGQCRRSPHPEPERPRRAAGRPRSTLPGGSVLARRRPGGEGRRARHSGSPQEPDFRTLLPGRSGRRAPGHRSGSGDRPRDRFGPRWRAVGGGRRGAGQRVSSRPVVAALPLLRPAGLRSPQRGPGRTPRKAKRPETVVPEVGARDRRGRGRPRSYWC